MLKSIKDRNGTILAKDKDIMKRWRKYFGELQEEEMEYIDEENNNEVGIHRKRENLENADDGITKDQMEEAILKLRLGKAPRTDQITVEMTEYLIEEKQNCYKW